jgi:hypothetical protein
MYMSTEIDVCMMGAAAVKSALSAELLQEAPHKRCVAMPSRCLDQLWEPIAAAIHNRIHGELGHKGGSNSIYGAL